VSARPALPCPPWCNGDHADHGYGAMTSHQVHRYASGRADDGPRVSLYMHDAGTGYPELASANGQVRLIVAASDEVRSMIMIDLDDRTGPAQARTWPGCWPRSATRRSPRRSASWPS
jgi:hypothetical protein